MPRIALLPGDGIGLEVTREAVKCLDVVANRFGLELHFEAGLVGGVAVEAVGRPLPLETMELCLSSDAILFGAVGAPKYDGLPRELRPEQALLTLRKELGLYANLRPARAFQSLLDASTLKEDVVRGVDIMVVRELTGGIYFGKPRGIEPVEGGERAVDTLIYTTGEIERIARIAFQAATMRRKKVTSVDKANVLASSELWRRVASEVAKGFPDVTLEHMYVDNCAMQLVRNPRQFDVILTENMFGDILSDEAAMLVGSIGMLPSASIGARVGIYEPVHGSAPDLAGKDIANPIAAILSAAMMLRYAFGKEEVAEAIERAVTEVLDQGFRTPDIHSPGTHLVGTMQMGDLIALKLSTLTPES